MGFRRAIVGACLVVTATTGCGDAPAENVAYVLPQRLPAGWVVKLATERPDQPVERDKPDGETASDYTVSWSPPAAAGADRAAAIKAPDVGAVLFINVASPIYAKQYGPLPANPARAKLQTKGDLLRIEFTKHGSVVAVSGREVSVSVLRDAASSLKTFGRAEWRRRLGSRLLVDKYSP